MRRAARLLLPLGLLARSAVAAPPDWIEVRSPHFTVYSNAGEGEARRTAQQFELARATMLKLWPWVAVDRMRSPVIFAVRDEKTLRSLGPQYWEGDRFRPASLAARVGERDFFAVRTDLRGSGEIGDNPFHHPFWIYASGAFGRSFPGTMPAWYQRGLAELVSNILVQKQEIHVGRPRSGLLQLLRERGYYPMPEFLAAGGDSPWVREEGAVDAFDAQAWAVLHYLMFGDEGAHAARLDRFHQLLRSGATGERATAEALGDLQALAAGVRLHVNRKLFRYHRVQVSLAEFAGALAAKPLAAAEAALARAEFLVAMRRPVEARALAAEARAADPAGPGPHEIEAALLEAAGDEAGARAALEKAVAAGSRNARAHYRLAQLSWSPSPGEAGLARLSELLERAIALDPDDADPQSFLAEVRLEQGRTAEALPLARRAVELEGRVTYHQLALARALWHGGPREEGLAAAQAGMDVARSAQDREQARRTLDFFGRVTPVAAPTGTPAASAPDDAIGQRVQALLAECARSAPVGFGRPFRVTVEVAGGRVASARAEPATPYSQCFQQGLAGLEVGDGQPVSSFTIQIGS
jgi:tetratricopeptide (TPR) repeat protein